MQNTRLWEAFSSLAKSELRAFDKFVRSPFFNQKTQLVGLFDYLRHCNENSFAPQSDAAWSAAYPGLTYDDQKLRLANSDLLKLLEHYLMYQEKFADLERNKIRLAGAYRKRNLPRHAEVSLREARQSREARPFRHAEYFDDLHRIELEQFQSASAAKRYEAFNLQEISDLMDKTYIARKLRHVCFALSHQAVTRAPYRFGLLEAGFAHVEAEGLLEIPAIALYYHGCHFLADPAAEMHFSRFREILSTHADQFPTDELRALYLLAINFGIKKSNETSDNGWYRATFELYREALVRNLLLENGMISRFAYHNIVGVAIRLQEVAWAEEFIQKYKPALERRYRESSFSLNMARVAYTRQQYRESLLHLQRADYKDFINGMNAKTLQLKIYFETGEFELLESHLDSIKNYIRRQRDVGYHRENYLNIARFTRIIIRLDPNDTEAAHELRRQIEAEAVLTEKEWLLGRLIG
ncbi:MAG: hypothetical protein JNJ90_15315 [Saprospiraceae bacterium]|jgi:hypothetical protein|nr:hypothetical protein [Saprospiraceae bacterium]